MGGDSIEQQPYDSSDDFMLHPLVRRVQECLLSPAEQRALLQYPCGTISRASGPKDPLDRNGLHMLRFCAGTSAALPHHKLATLRAETANRDSIPTDWLDLAAVAQSYKLDPLTSQAGSSASANASAINAGSVAGSHPEAASCDIPEIPDCKKIQHGGVPPNAGVVRGASSFENDGKNCMADRDAANDSAGLNSAQTPSRHYDTSATAAKGSFISKLVRPAQQRPGRGSSARSSSVKDIDGVSEIPSTPVTASRLPQCCATRTSIPTASPTSSHERHIRASSVTASKSAFVRRPWQPDQSWCSQPTSSDTH